MKTLIKRLLDLTVQIQQIPAPTFAESERAEFVHGLFLQEKLDDVSIDDSGNVYARLAGGNEAPLIVSAHIDTVFPIDTNLNVTRKRDRIAGPGVGDNTLGVASLFGLLWLLQEKNIALPGDLWFVANTCEEGLGDLRGMRAVVGRFGKEVQAYLIIEGLSLGYIQHRALGVQRYRISMKTSGGHSWSDYGQPSALHELSKLVTRLTSVPLPEQPRTTINVGRMGGGTSVNAIAADAWLELDLRSESPQVLIDLAQVVEELVRVAGRPGVQVDAEVIGRRPAGELSPTHPLVELAKDCIREQGLEPRLIIGSTDANIPLSMGIPALVLGITNGAGAHTTEEFIYTAPVAKGLNQLLHFVVRVWGQALY